MASKTMGKTQQDGSRLTANRPNESATVTGTGIPPFASAKAHFIGYFSRKGRQGAKNAK